MPRSAGAPLADTDRCPCGSGLQFGECCLPLHKGKAAPTAEALMRSRYSAYATGNVDYLRSSWAPETCPDPLTLEEEITWTGLEIVGKNKGGPFDQTGTVTFVAHYQSPNGSQHSMREHSQFVRHDGRWVYLDAVD